MYSVSDVIEMGEAHELVLSHIKQVWVQDDSSQQSMRAEENFDN